MYFTFDFLSAFKVLQVAYQFLCLILHLYLNEFSRDFGGVKVRESIKIGKIPDQTWVGSYIRKTSFNVFMNPPRIVVTVRFEVHTYITRRLYLAEWEAQADGREYLPGTTYFCPTIRWTPSHEWNILECGIKKKHNQINKEINLAETCLFAEVNYPRNVRNEREKAFVHNWRQKQTLSNLFMIWI